MKKGIFLIATFLFGFLNINEVKSTSQNNSEIKVNDKIIPDTGFDFDEKIVGGAYGRCNRWQVNYCRNYCRRKGMFYRSCYVRYGRVSCGCRSRPYINESN